MRPPNRSIGRRFGVLLVVLLVLTAAGVTLLSQALDRAGVAPRQLAPYIERRAAGHRPAIVAAGNFLGNLLMVNDRGERAGRPIQWPRLRIGAQPGATADPDRATHRIVVSSSAAALGAMQAASPGDVIEFAPGRYAFKAAYFSLTRAGTAGQPITVRAAVAGSVTIALDTAEGFLVDAPYWRFENLVVTGACPVAAFCDHAFHVVGKGAHFVARNNTVRDFNAAFKINGSGALMPDDGLLEANTLLNGSIRPTDAPVTPIDLVGASGWIIRRNFIADFIKGEGDQTSYGAYAKGGGSGTLFENNIVLCEYRLRGAPGARVGLSLGGGGTGAAYCRDGHCSAEQSGGILRANLIAACSDDGIYLNRAAASQVIHNTVLDTAGVSVRYPESDALLEGNLIDGAVRTRNGATVRERDDITTAMLRIFLGSHPVRRLLDPGGDIGLTGTPPRRARTGEGAVVPDLCGTHYSGARAYGAFLHFDDCRRF